MNKMFVRIVNSEDSDQTASSLIRLLLKKQSDLSLHCLSGPFWQLISVQNFRLDYLTFTSPNILNIFLLYFSTKSS